jgi:hypothetical protein
MSDSIGIPRERVIPIATEAASNAKTVGSVMCFFLGLFVIAAIGIVADRSGGNTTTGRSMDAGSLVVGLGVWFLVLGAIANRFLGNARRATAAVRAASSTTEEYTFTLAGNLVIAANSAAVPLPDRSFKVSRRLRTMLLAVPRATVVDSDR